MRILPQKDILLRSGLIYRKIRYRRGFGVHSPFVFNLITKVIGEKGHFYRFHDIELIRKRLLQSNETISIRDIRSGKEKKAGIAGIVQKKAISAKKGELLFRLANHLQSRNILQVGSSVGISTLYLTSYAPGLTCISIEADTFSGISQWVYQEAARTKINVLTGEYNQLFVNALQEGQKPDLIFFNGTDEQMNTLSLFITSIPYVEDRTVFVFDGIKKNKQMRTTWKEIIAHPEVTVSLDLFSLGIVFLNKKLHKRNYKVYF